MTKKFSEYYPNQIAKDNKYEKYLKDPNRLYRECRELHFDSEKVGVKKAYVYQEFHMWKEWKNGGKNIFHFSKNLIELLKETDVLDIDLSLIKLPYYSFYIDLSEAKMPFEENGSEFIDGVFIRDEQDDGDNGQSFERAINIDFVGNDYIEKYWTINKDLCWDTERGFHSTLLFLDRKDNLKTVEDAIKFDKKGFVGSQAEVAAPFMFLPKQACRGKCAGINFIDSTSLIPSHNRRIHKHRIFKGMAQRRKTTTGWFFGFKLQLIINEKGELTSLLYYLIIPNSGYLMSIRFLTDYLTGDKYYKINYPTHNLVRAKNQGRLTEMILKQMGDLNQIINNYTAVH